MTYVVNRRKADKSKMRRALRKEINSIIDAINELEQRLIDLNRFRSTLEGKDGVERAGALYEAEEDTGAAYGSILPHDVVRIYNSHSS